MNIFTIKSNLENTIAGKEAMLKGINDTTYGKMMAQFLEVNIDELKRILADVEVVANKTMNEIYRNG